MFKKLKEFFTGESKDKGKDKEEILQEEVKESEETSDQPKAQEMDSIREEPSQTLQVEEVEMILSDTEKEEVEEEHEDIFVTEGHLAQGDQEAEKEDALSLKEENRNEESLQEQMEKEESSKKEENEVSEDVSQEDEIKEKEEAPSEDQEKGQGFFARLKAGLSKTAQSLTGRLDQLFQGHIEIDEELYEEIEEILITADIGFDTTLKIVEMLRSNIRKKSIQDVAGVRSELKLIIEELLSSENSALNLEPAPAIIVIVGVNGVGKTTSIGKIAMKLKREGKTVLLAAADTFRAAAAEQLSIWAQRAEVEIVKHQEGADPSAVIFDAIHKAKSNRTDVLICDTAGRLHNKKNLMQELAKIFRIIEREYPQAVKEVLLVIDATTGQNAVNQVKIFKEAAPLSGIILTKLDGTAKGGVAISIKSGLDVPIKLIGVGEKIDDLQEFDAKNFSSALFDR